MFTATVLKLIYIFFPLKGLFTDFKKRRHGVNSPPPSTIEEYFTPILLGLTRIMLLVIFANIY